MKITMLATVNGGSAYGSLTSGATYDLPYDYAKSLVDAGNASYKYPAAVFVDPPDSVSAAAVAAATSRSSVAKFLVSAYEAEQRKSQVSGGPFRLPRTSLLSADIPAITSSSTAPSSDADAAAKNIVLSGLGSTRGSTDVNITSAAEIAQLKKWVFGFNPGLRVRWGYNAYRLSNGLGALATNGNQDQDSSIGYGINNNGVYTEFMLYGDRLFMSAGGSDTKFMYWVNDNLLSTASMAAGTNISADSSTYLYGPTGSGRVYVKLKWATAAWRKIRIQHMLSQGLGDFYIGATHTMYPINPSSRINALYIGDSFGEGTGASPTHNNLAEWCFSQFGTNINLTNVSLGSTGFYAGPALSPVKPDFGQMFDLCTSLLPQQHVVLVVGVQNDASSVAGSSSAVSGRMAALFSKIYAHSPNALIFVVPNTSVQNIGSSTALPAEDLLTTTVSSYSYMNLIPVLRDAGGAWLYGTGHVGATTGDGNADLFVSSADTVHPSTAGHQYWGQRIAQEIYNQSLTISRVG